MLRTSGRRTDARTDRQGENSIPAHKHSLRGYNYETDGDPTVLDCPHIPGEEYLSILLERGEAAVKALKMGSQLLITYQLN